MITVFVLHHTVLTWRILRQPFRRDWLSQRPDRLCISVGLWDLLGDCSWLGLNGTRIIYLFCCSRECLKSMITTKWVSILYLGKHLADFRLRTWLTQVTLNWCGVGLHLAITLLRMWLSVLFWLALIYQIVFCKQTSRWQRLRVCLKEPIYLSYAVLLDLIVTF